MSTCSWVQSVTHRDFTTAFRANPKSCLSREAGDMVEAGEAVDTFPHVYGTLSGRWAQRAKRDFLPSRISHSVGRGTGGGQDKTRDHCSPGKEPRTIRQSHDGRVWKALFQPRCRQGLPGTSELRRGGWGVWGREGWGETVPRSVSNRKSWNAVG